MCVLIGYVAKRITPRPAGFEPSYVREIASVSDCIAERPVGWLEEWAHNDWFVYDTPELARQIADKLGAGTCAVVAYLVWPTRFEETGEVRFDLRTEAVAVPAYFARLGWDVVSRSVTPEFECSPLSCNGMATEIAVNDVCLLSSLDEAITIARRFAREQPEPGTYFVVEVWRELLAE